MSLVACRSEDWPTTLTLTSTRLFSPTAVLYDCLRCQQQTAKALCFRVARPSVRWPLTPISRVAISLYLVEGFHWNLPQIFIMWVSKAEKVFKVKGQGHCTNAWMIYGGGIHFDDVVTRFTCCLITPMRAAAHDFYLSPSPAAAAVCFCVMAFHCDEIRRLLSLCTKIIDFVQST